MPFGFSRKDRERESSYSTGFRPDIQGLRALAVLSVVLFHLKISHIGGGYTGVDIFFVISGYLITRNILSDVQAGRFTFVHFYARRIRRIFPAMLATVAATVIAGALWLPPAQFVTQAQSGLASLLFVSNVYFWWNANQYFAADSNFISLLHLWSLSVEEQFYIFWPLIIVLIARWRASRLMLGVAAIGLVSYVCAFVFDHGGGGGAFYLMPFRVYQFALGALALFVERSVSANIRIQRAAQIVGLLLCAVGIFALTSHLRLLGVAAALGAALVIYGGSQRASMPLLTNPVATYIGRISYSLYLVHWPVAVFANYVYGDAASGLIGLGIQLVIIFALAALTYRFIERPFLAGHNAPQKASPVRMLIATSAVLAVLCALIMTENGWTWRLNGAQQQINQMEAFGVAPCARDKTSCHFGKADGKLAAILIGDSYAQHYVAAIDHIAAPLGLRVDEQIQQGCLILSGLVRVGYPDRRCWTGRDRVLAAVKDSPAPVIISEAWLGYLTGNVGDDTGRPVDAQSEQARIDVLEQGLERTIREISRPARRILIIGAQVIAPCDLTPARLGIAPLPHQQGAPCKPRTSAEARSTTQGVDDMLSRVQAKFPSTVSLIFPVDHMCEATCPTVQDGVWLYEDAGHLTVAGSLHFAQGAAAPIANFLSGRTVSR